MSIPDYTRKTFSNLRYLLTGRPSEQELYNEVGNLLRIRNELRELEISNRKDLTTIFEAAPRKRRSIELNRKIRYAELEGFKGKEAKEYILKQFEIEGIERQRMELSRHR